MPPARPPIPSLSRRQFPDDSTPPRHSSSPLLFFVILAIGIVVFLVALGIAIKCFWNRKKRKLALQAQIIGVGNYHYVPGTGGGGAVVAVPYPGAPQAAPPVPGEVAPIVDLRPIQGYYSPPAPAPAPGLSAETTAARANAPPLEGYFAPAAPAPVVIPRERGPRAARLPGGGTGAGPAGRERS